jgi:hypothetical protein
MPKVFVTQEPVPRWNAARTQLLNPVDISPARAYGDLQIMFPPAHNLSVLSVPLVAQARTLLKDFTDDDYILAIGNPVMMAVVCAIAAELNNGRFRVLVWDKRDRNYIEYRVNTRGTP